MNYVLKTKLLNGRTVDHNHVMHANEAIKCMRTDIDEMSHAGFTVGFWEVWDRNKLLASYTRNRVTHQPELTYAASDWK